MDGRKVIVEVKELDLLEQKVQKAIELIRGLRRERDVARLKLQETQQQFDRLQAEFRALEKDREGASQLSAQLETLREERQTIRGRVTRMLDLMATLDDSATQAQIDH